MPEKVRFGFWKIFAAIAVVDAGVPMFSDKTVEEELAGAMVIARLAELVPAEFAAEIVAVVLPCVVGVPDISPLDVLTTSPAGIPVALNEVGLLLAVIWKLKLCPTVPLAVAGLVMTGATTVPALEFRGLGEAAEKSPALSPVSVAPPPALKTAKVEEPAGAGPAPS